MQKVQGETPRRSKSGIPVVLLSGFLGAGKTTMLENFLVGDHGLKLGIIVNDLASVNVDARVLDSAIKKADAKSMELSNGCVCCTASDDLRKSLLSLASDRGEGALDAIIVELSGVAEPAAARTVFDELWYEPPAHIARTVTVVDAKAFAADFNAPMPSGTDANERLSALLAEQVEDADIVVLNKADVASAEELRQAEAVVRALNSGAELLTTSQGRVEVRSLLPADLLDRKEVPSIQHDHGHGQSHEQGHGHSHGEEACNDAQCTDAGHSHEHGHSHGGEVCADVHCSDDSHNHGTPSSERRFGIKSFVYTASRPFSRYHFMMLLQKWQLAWTKMGKELQLVEESSAPASEAAAPDGTWAKLKAWGNQPVMKASPLTPVLRSKGLIWMDTQVEDALDWGQAGRCIRLKNLGPWMRDGPRITEASTEPAGDEPWPPRTELVFIGAGMDEVAVREALDACLLSEEEHSAASSKAPAAGQPQA